MTILEPKFKRATSIPKGGTRVLAKVASGEYDAALFVIKPDPKLKLFKIVNGNDKLQFAEIKDWDLNDKLPSGKPVYDFKSVKVKDSWLGGKVDTICTTASVFVRTDIDDDVADDLSDLLLTHQKFLIGE